MTKTKINPRSQKNNHIYSKSQILSGVISAILFLATIIWLNVRGFTKTPNWAAKPSKTPIPSATPMVSPLNFASLDLKIPANSILYAQDNVLMARLLKEDQNRAIASFSGKIGKIGRLKDRRIFLFSGKSKDNIDNLFIQKDQRFQNIILPPIKITQNFPILSADGNYVYFINNTGNKDVIFKHEIKTGVASQIVESSLPVDQMAVNDTNTLMVLGIKMNLGKITDSHVLGIVQMGAKNLNLYPAVEIRANSPLFFGTDDQSIFLETMQGIGVFDIRVGKITQNIDNRSLFTGNSTDQVLMASGNTIASKCRDGLNQIQGFRQIELQNFTNNSFNLIDNFNLLSKQNPTILFSLPLKFDHFSDNWVFKIVDNTCSVKLLMYNRQGISMDMIDLGKIDDTDFIYVP